MGRALGQLVDAGALRLDLPGGGATPRRHDALAEVAAVDLSLARLAEGHADALAILAEAGRVARPQARYGVWAADPPNQRLSAERSGGGWTLGGTKRYCSGARTLTAALVSAFVAGEDDPRLFVVDLASAGVTPVPGTWPAVGMAGSDSLDVVFDGVTVAAEAEVATPGWYLGRPGFWHGSVGVAACWYGGALGALRSLRHRLAERGGDDHAFAHLGAVTARCAAMASVLTAAGNAIDADPLDDAAAGKRRALVVREVVESGVTDVVAHVGRAGGSSLMVFDAAHARRSADLPVYVRQSHAERDQAELGRLEVENID